MKDSASGVEFKAQVGQIKNIRDSNYLWVDPQNDIIVRSTPPNSPFSLPMSSK